MAGQKLAVEEDAGLVIGGPDSQEHALVMTVVMDGPGIPAAPLEIGPFRFGQ